MTTIQLYGTIGGEVDPEQLEAAYNACEDKGATIPEDKTLENLADCIETIPSAEIIPPDAGTLQSIVVGTLPKVSYTEGEALDLTGCVILANYSGGGQYDVTQRCVFTANNPVQYNDTSIGVSFTDDNEDTATLDILITVAGISPEVPADTIALYHLDGNLKDEVSGETETGTYQQIAGKFNKGAKGYQWSPYPNLTKIAISASDFGSKNYTIEFWGHTDTNNGYAPNLRYNGSYSNFFNSSSLYTYGLELSTDFAKNKTLIYAPTSIDTSKWHHFAVVFSGANYTTYLDGKKSVTGELKTISSNISNICLFATSAIYDEVLFTGGVKYVADFEPPHNAYHLANNE